MKLNKHKIRIFFYKIKKDLKKIFNSIFDEINTIIRNKKYAKNYPELFAIFSIVEHEQSPQVFETNNENFELIKLKILHDAHINNSHILDSIRNLFQSTKISESKDLTRDKILNFLIHEVNKMMDSNNKYYSLLINASLRIFPILLNYNEYSLFKKLISEESKQSLLKIKYILNSHNFPNFFIEKEDAVKILLYCYHCDNKASFMMMIRYIRKNDLFEYIFDKNIDDIKNKILNFSSINKRSVNYSSVLLSYYEDKWIKSDKKLEKIHQFLHEIFSHNLDASEKKSYSEAFNTDILMAKSMEFNNKIIENILDGKTKKPSNIKYKINDLLSTLKNKNIRNVKHLNKPSSKIYLKDFKLITQMAPEEYWLLRFYDYL